MVPDGCGEAGIPVQLPVRVAQPQGDGAGSAVTYRSAVHPGYGHDPTRRAGEKSLVSPLASLARALPHASEPADKHVYEAHKEVYEGHEQVEQDPEYLHDEIRDVVEETRRAEDHGQEQYHRQGHQRSAHHASPPLLGQVLPA